MCGGLANFDAEFEEFSMDPGRAPKRIGQAHVANQLANFERHLWSAATTSRLPSPERAKTGTMPTDNCLRLDDHQGIHNARRDPIEAAKTRRSKLLNARLSLPKSRFERTDDGARQGSGAQQRLRTARSGVCRARLSQAKHAFALRYNKWHMTQGFGEGAPCSTRSNDPWALTT
jgi:hypothetical protein